jgi:hypothetical protein
MQSQQLRPHKVVSPLDICGNLHGDMPVILDHLLGAPLAGGGVVVGVPDLEPPVAGGVVVGRRVVDFLHVHGAGALVAYVDGARARAVGVFAEFEGEG